MNQRPQKIEPQAPQPAADTLAAQPAATQPDLPAASPAPPPARQRQRFGVQIARLGIETLAGKVREGYVPRWINDDPGRIPRALKSGYSHINDDDGKPIKQVVDKVTGTEAYAMEIPREFYDDDFAAKQREEDTKEDAILRATIGDGGYRPTIGGTDQPRSSMQAVRGRAPFGQ